MHPEIREKLTCLDIYQEESGPKILVMGIGGQIMSFMIFLVRFLKMKNHQNLQLINFGS